MSKNYKVKHIEVSYNYAGGVLEALNRLSKDEDSDVIYVETIDEDGSGKVISFNLNQAVTIVNLLSNLISEIESQ